MQPILKIVSRNHSYQRRVEFFQSQGRPCAYILCLKSDGHGIRQSRYFQNQSRNPQAKRLIEYQDRWSVRQVEVHQVYQKVLLQGGPSPCHH